MTQTLRYAFIDGRYCEREGAETFQDINPFTLDPLADIVIASQDEVDTAVASAQAAFEQWSKLSGTARGAVLNRAADLIASRREEIAWLESLDAGKPLSETPEADVDSAIDCLRFFASVAPTIAGEQKDLGGPWYYTRREPLGVVGGIGAWNYPFQIACWKAAPALAAGNAMVFKPAELTPLSAYVLAEILIEAGAPAGLFNVVQGDGTVGRMLTAHPGIAKISFTGEVETGKAVMRDSASTLKHVTLELGGKSPLVIFDDADIDDAVNAAMLGNFYTQGQICTNCTRVFVHENIKSTFLSRLLDKTNRMVLGDPLDPATHVGPLISPEHCEKVLGYLDIGKAEGARILIGGGQPQDPALAGKSFVEPTVFFDCTDDMTICRQEIFGPVMSVLSFSDEADVIARANALPFGLAAGVMTKDMQRAHRVAAALEAGVVWINTYNLTPVEMPFGGTKHSGLGRENGLAAIEHVTQVKSIYVETGSVESPYQ